MTTRTPNRRWHHLTPDRLFIGLLVVQVFLLLSERFKWFAFNERKGWTVLIAVGVVVRVLQDELPKCQIRNGVPPPVQGPGF